MIKFKPETLGFRVLIKPSILGKKTESGIMIATDERTQATNSDKGEVLAIGSEAWKTYGFKEPPVKVGDMVFYAKYGCKTIKDEDTDDLYIIANDEDILVGYTNE